MKITINSLNDIRCCSIEVHDETPLDDLLREIENLLKLYGYCFDGKLVVYKSEQM